jgi:hypothetical protein
VPPEKEGFPSLSDLLAFPFRPSGQDCIANFFGRLCAEVTSLECRFALDAAARLESLISAQGGERYFALAME